MKLFRLASLIFSQADTNFKSWKIDSGKVEVRTLKSQFTDDNKWKVIIIATIKLDRFPQIDDKNQIIIPETERKVLEFFIENSGNIISVSTNMPRSILSPDPNSGIIHENNEERLWLEKSNGILIKMPNQPSAINEDPIPIYQFMNELSDRYDGLALLCESINTNHASGKFKEYIRIFERAFTKSSKNLITPLTNYLKPLDLNYLHDEIDNWIEIRGGTSHADRDRVFYEYDVIPVLGRVKTAALDILFNKTNWRSNDSARRSLWKVPSGPLDRNMGLFITQGKNVKINFHILDDFGVFGRDFSSLNNSPNDWYIKTIKLE